MDWGGLSMIIAGFFSGFCVGILVMTYLWGEDEDRREERLASKSYGRLHRRCCIEGCEEPAAPFLEYCKVHSESKSYSIEESH